MAENKLPEFNTLTDLVEFFDTHDLGEYFDEMPEVSCEVNLRPSRCFVTIDQYLLKQFSYSGETTTPLDREFSEYLVVRKSGAGYLKESKVDNRFIVVHHFEAGGQRNTCPISINLSPTGLGVSESLPDITVFATTRLTTPLSQTLKDNSESRDPFGKMTERPREQRREVPNHLGRLNETAIGMIPTPLGNDPVLYQYG